MAEFVEAHAKFKLIRGVNGDGSVAAGGLVDVALRYTTADPYALKMTFTDPARPKESVAWFMARDLLLEGVDVRAGLADVQVWPHSKNKLRLQLRSPEGNALLSMPRDEVRRFLDVTLSMVPRGQESQHLDVDACVAKILERA